MIGKAISRVCNAGRVGILIFSRFIAYLFVRDSRKVVMGAWMGNLFADNPKYLLSYILEHTDLQVVWIGNECVRDKLPCHACLRFAKKGSMAAVWALLTAKNWVCCQAWNIDLTTLPILGTGRCIDLWHGIPIKYVGRQVAAGVWAQGEKVNLFQGINRRFALYEPEWLVVSSDKMAEIMVSGVPSRYAENRVLRFGTPRNDFLINHSCDADLIRALKQKYAEMLGFNPSRKIVLYLPTWRIRGDCVYAFYNDSLERQQAVRELLHENEAVLIEKHHYGTYKSYPITKSSYCSIVVTVEQQSEVDVQEMLLIADMLISDYSGAYIDFGLLQRPMIHYAYDYQDYCTKDSGLAYDLREVAAGPIVKTHEELIHELKVALENPQFLPAPQYKDLVAFERGIASEQIVKYMAGK